MTKEQLELTRIEKELYDEFGREGKCILDKDRLFICQSNFHVDDVRSSYPKVEINPIGDCTGGPDVGYRSCQLEAG